MTITERIRSAARRARALFGGGQPRAGVSTSYQLFQELGRTMSTYAGPVVNADTAMRVSAVNACVRVIAETVGSLPLLLYRRRPDGGKERAADHQLYRLLHDRPNEWQTAMEFREMMQAHVTLRGNAYALKARVAGRLDELIPIHPDRVECRYEAGRISYKVAPIDGVGSPRDYGRAEIFHLRGLSSNGVVGRSPIADARDAVGLALAQERFSAAAFDRGGVSRIVLRHPNKLSGEAHARVAKSWVESYGGEANYHKPAILEEGMEVDKISMSAEDLQFIDSRKLQIADIARVFRVPLHLIGELDRSTNNNIEHQSLEFVMHTIRPWLVRWEQAITRDLLDPTDEDLFAEHLVDGLLRGDVKTRYEAYAIARQWGWMNADEIRERENMNPIPDGNGTRYLVPLNMQDPAQPQPAPSRAPQENDQP